MPLPTRNVKENLLQHYLLTFGKYTFGKGRHLARIFAAIHGELFLQVCFSLFEGLKTQWRKIKQMQSMESFFFLAIAFSLDGGCCMMV